MRSGDGDVEATGRFLVRCAKAIRARGLKLVFNAGEVFEPGGGPCVGCCVTHAQEHIPKHELKKLGEMVLPEDEVAFDRAWDAIEAGFDGLAPVHGYDLHDAPHPFPWWDLGVRLRRKLSPGDASKLERRLARRGAS